MTWLDWTAESLIAVAAIICILKPRWMTKIGSEFTEQKKFQIKTIGMVILLVITLLWALQLGLILISKPLTN